METALHAAETLFRVHSLVLGLKQQPTCSQASWLLYWPGEPHTSLVHIGVGVGTTGVAVAVDVDIGVDVGVGVAASAINGSPLARESRNTASNNATICEVQHTLFPCDFIGLFVNLLRPGMIRFCVVDSEQPLALKTFL
jgi:hypothetical protein